MKQMTRLLTGAMVALALTCGDRALAQGLEDVPNDAMRYGRMDFLGSARSTGLGGATTALGADLGALWSNPAGLGMYRSSDLSFSLGVGAGGLNLKLRVKLRN
jgi:hypothetical protein